jgi:hypothetical protein
LGNREKQIGGFVMGKQGDGIIGKANWLTSSYLLVVL